MAFKIGPFENLGVGIAKNFFCLAKFLFVSFEVWRKHPWWSPFQVHFHTFLEVSAAVQSSYSAENPLAPASEERNSAVNIISGVLKTPTAVCCILQVCKFLIRNLIRDDFLEIFCKFWRISNKLSQEFVFSSVQTLYCKPVFSVKRGLLKISRRATFRNIPCAC